MSDSRIGWSRSRIADRIVGSLWIWDHVYGPYYNYRVRKAGADMYGPFADAVNIDGCVRVIDVGCGPGVLTCMLAERYPDASFVGVDYSSGQIKSADRLLSRTGVGNCRFVQGDAMNLRIAASISHQMTTSSIPQ